MKKIIFSLFILNSFLLKAQGIQIADVGFQNENFYISVLPDFSGDEVTFELEYCFTDSEDPCIKISDCIYLESHLKREIQKVQNSAIRDDFSWIFSSTGQSGYSSENLTNFLNDFILLLKRANPKCQDLSLPLFPLA